MAQEGLREPSPQACGVCRHLRSDKYIKYKCKYGHFDGDRGCLRHWEPGIVFICEHDEGHGFCELQLEYYESQGCDMIDPPEEIREKVICRFAKDQGCRDYEPIKVIPGEYLHCEFVLIPVEAKKKTQKDALKKAGFWEEIKHRV